MITRMIRALIRSIPEGFAKHQLRMMLLSMRNGMPKELVVNRGNTVVQVGMWRPAAAVRLADSIGSTGRLLLIEMSSEAIDSVRETIEESSCQNVDFVNKGAWNSKGEIEIIEGETPATTRIDTGRLHPGSMENECVKKFPVDTIENICRENGVDQADYMEITVNGAEVDAIQGMGEMLQNTKRLWVAGLTRDTETGEPLNKEISKLLQSHGFRTKISKTEKSPLSNWGVLDGHVYAWRP